MPLSDDGAALRLKDDDNVAVCLRTVVRGSAVRFGGDAVTAVADIPAGHKIALRPIAADERVLKYGQPIGKATCPIAAGEHVHVHNVEGLRARGDLAEQPA